MLTALSLFIDTNELMFHIPLDTHTHTIGNFPANLLVSNNMQISPCTTVAHITVLIIFLLAYTQISITQMMCVGGGEMVEHKQMPQ